MKKQKSFVFYESWAEALRFCPFELRAQYYDAIVNYALYGTEPTLSNELLMAFNLIKKDIDRAQENYDRICEVRRNAIKKRWNKTNEDKSEKIQNDTNVIQTDTTVDNNKDKYKDKDKDKDKDISTSVDKKNKQKKGCEFELAREFELFRKAYPGSKRSLEVELANLKRKFPQNWREIIPQLRPALERLLEYHRALAEARSRGARVFAPNFANLSTWLNNCRWQDEYPDINRQINLTDYGTNTNIRHYPQQSADERKAEFQRRILEQLTNPYAPEPDISDCY